MWASSWRAEVEAMPERLLNHHATPEARLAALVLVLIGELGLAEMLHDGAEQPIRDREIEDGVAFRTVGLFGFSRALPKLLVQLRLGQVAPDINHFLREALPHRLIEVIDIELGGSVADEALQRVVKLRAPGFRGTLRTRHPDQHEVLRQHLGAREVVECRHHQAVGQIPGGAEDHHGAGVGWLRLPPGRRLHDLRGARLCRGSAHNADASGRGASATPAISGRDQFKHLHDVKISWTPLLARFVSVAG